MRNQVRREHIREEHDFRIKAMQHFERTEAADRRMEYKAIQDDISPQEYERLLDWCRTRTSKDTGGWLLQNSIFKQWLDTKNTVVKMLWVKGDTRSWKIILGEHSYRHGARSESYS